MRGYTGEIGVLWGKTMWILSWVGLPWILFWVEILICNISGMFILFLGLCVTSYRFIYLFIFPFMTSGFSYWTLPHQYKGGRIGFRIMQAYWCRKIKHVQVTVFSTQSVEYIHFCKSDNSLLLSLKVLGFWFTLQKFNTQKKNSSTKRPNRVAVETWKN